MPSLTPLPNEILLQIIHHLTPSPSSLSALTRTSHHLQALAHPVLYSIITTPYRSSLPRLFISVLESPHLWQNVTSFHAQTHASSDNIYADNPSLAVDISHMPFFALNKLKTERRMRRRMAPLYGRRFCAHWHDRLFRGERNWEPVVAWLVHAFQGTLRELRVDITGLVLCRHLDRMLKIARRRQIGVDFESRNGEIILERLREVYVSKDRGGSESEWIVGVEGGGSIEMRFVVPYLNLPSIEKVVVWGLGRDYMPRHPPDEQYCFGTKSLVLRGHILDEKALEGFLGCFKGLETVICEKGGRNLERSVDRFLDVGWDETLLEGLLADFDIGTEEW